MIPLGILSQSHGVYKNVALVSNGGSVTLNSGTAANGTAISNVIKGNREIATGSYTTDSAYITTDATFTFDLGGVTRNIKELNFCSGYASGYTKISENIPNNNLSVAAGISFSLTPVVEYSTDGSSYTTLSSSFYTGIYLFSQNILSSTIIARYIRISTKGEMLISGIEAWGLN